MPDIFLSSNPAEPWSFYPLGLPAFAIVAAGLALLTIWTYLGHPQVSRRRLTLVLALRMAALFVALLTALRPSLGIQEDPKIPSVLLIGIDMSESMTVSDGLDKSAPQRIADVRKVLARCEPTLRELREEQNVNVVMYAFGNPDFNDATGLYDPNAAPKFNRSDYSAYLKKTFDRWQAERFIRGHVVVGDGAHNGATAPEPEAARWRQLGRAVHTFAVGRTDIAPDSRDVSVTSATVTTGSPDGAVFIKTEFTLKVVINAYGFVGAKVPVVVSFDTGEGYKTVETAEAKLEKDRDNVVEIKLKAPDKPGEIKLKVEVPPKDVPGDVAPSNNTIETYLTVTKEGLRILFVDRLNWEHAEVRRALAADPRIDLYEVIRQTDEPATPQEREDFDFDNRAYDVIILGNVSAQQLRAIDPQLPAKIAEQVTQKGVGLLMTGGHATFLGTPGVPGTGWKGVKEIEDILPVTLGKTAIPENVFTDERARYQFLPTQEHANHYLVRLGATEKETTDLWARLNDEFNYSRFTGLSNVGTPRAGASVFAVAAPARGNIPPPVKMADMAKYPPVLVGHQIGVGNRGRVLVLAALDTFLWQRLGQPKAPDGLQLHAKFWRQIVRWLAHQEQDDAAAFARPELPRLPVGGRQSIRVGLRAPGGAAAKDPVFKMKVIAPGETEATAQEKTPVPDPDGGFKLPYEPGRPGEFTVKLTATGKDKDGNPVTGEATARFLAYPEASDEMLRKAADHDTLKRIAAAGGGQFHRLEDLPGFLKELKAQPIDTAKPKPRYLPDWRREHSKGFLPGWLVLFVALLGAEWGLRRLWGMV